MYVCLCKGVSDKEIHQAVSEGHCTLSALRQELGVATQCGKCARCAREVLHEALREECACNPLAA